LIFSASGDTERAFYEGCSRRHGDVHTLHSEGLRTPFYNGGYAE
jgi:hypothetical protein